jgi:short-subunit dehydrogenase
MLDKSFQKKYGPWALILGAAEGIGEAYSLALAKEGLNLVMVDKNESSLNLLAQKLQFEYSIKCKTITLNLRDEKATETIMNMLAHIDCRLLIYNAAYSKVQRFIHLKKEDLDQFIDINCKTQLHLVHRFSTNLISKKKRGGIILMSSLAGLIGVQLVTPYAASKAFAWNLAEALHYELKAEGIDVMACLAGATDTPTYNSTHPKYGLIKPAVMSGAEVAEAALNALGKQHRFIPGFSNRINYFLLTRIFPRKWAASIANKTIFSMYKNSLD